MIGARLHPERALTCECGHHGAWAVCVDGGHISVVCGACASLHAERCTDGCASCGRRAELHVVNVSDGPFVLTASVCLDCLACEVDDLEPTATIVIAGVLCEERANRERI